MAPTSYQGPTVGREKKRTVSQSVTSNLSESGEPATVADILADKGRDVYSVAPGDKVRTAVSMLREHRIGALLVLSDGKLRGILSERDVVKQLDLEGAEVLDRTVADLMTADPFTCSPPDQLLSILRRMTDGHFRHMPVVDGPQLLGMISIGDVVKMRLRELEYEALRMKQMIVG